MPNKSLFRLRDFRKRRVFWRLFTNYFVLILIPVMAASLILYFYSVRMIEREVDHSNRIAMTNFSQNMDAFFDSLQAEAVEVLKHPQVNYFLRELYFKNSEYFIKTYERKQALDDLTSHLVNLENFNDLIQNTYIYFPQKKFIITKEGVFESEYFFRYENNLPDLDEEAFRELFAERRTMYFLGTQTVQRRQFGTDRVRGTSKVVSVINSFPFYAEPGAYFVINLDERELKRRITITDFDHIHTLILNESGQQISYAGEKELDTGAVSRAIGGRRNGSDTVVLDGVTYYMSFAESELTRWKYISLVELALLREPVSVIKNVSFVLLALFAVIGLVVSYGLSRRMYFPIQQIQSGFEKLKAFDRVDVRPEHHNELDLIRLWSDAVIVEHNEMSQQINDMKPLIQENALMTILSGQVSGSAAVREYAAKMGVDLSQHRRMIVLCLEVQFRDGLAGQGFPSGGALYMTELKNRLKSEFRPNLWLGEARKLTLAMLVRLDRNAKKLRVMQIVEQVSRILEDYRTYMTPVIGVGELVDELEQLPESYGRALRMLEFKTLSTEPQTIWDEHDDLHKPAMEGYLSSEDVGKLSNLIRDGDKRGLVQAITDILQSNIDSGTPAKRVIGFGHDILNTVTRVAGESSMNDYILGRYNELRSQLDRCADYAALTAFFARACDILLDIQEEERDDRSAIFREVTQYIEQHYTEDLSLELFADRYAMSLGYFSRCFKEHVGEKYVDFVNKVKLREAKRLLVETDDKIEDIAEQVGYLANKSFNTIFKKYEGITPGKYRSLYKHGAS